MRFRLGRGVSGHRARETTCPWSPSTTSETAVAGNQVTVRDRSLSVVANVSQTLSRVEGFARKDGKGLAGAMIVLVPRQPSAYRALVRRDQSDSDGSFSLRDVPAGQYTVIAIEDGWKLDWTRRDNLARFLAGGVSVTVGDKQGAVVSLSQPGRCRRADEAQRCIPTAPISAGASGRLLRGRGGERIVYEGT